MRYALKRMGGRVYARVVRSLRGGSSRPPRPSQPITANLPIGDQDMQDIQQAEFALICYLCEVEGSITSPATCSDSVGGDFVPLCDYCKDHADSEEEGSDRLY